MLEETKCLFSLLQITVKCGQQEPVITCITHINQYHDNDKGGFCPLSVKLDELNIHSIHVRDKILFKKMSIAYNNGNNLYLKLFLTLHWFHGYFPPYFIYEDTIGAFLLELYGIS